MVLVLEVVVVVGMSTMPNMTMHPKYFKGVQVVASFPNLMERTMDRIPSAPTTMEAE